MWNRDGFQVRANFRTAITIPERSWVRFRDVISEFAMKQPSGPPVSADVDRVVTGVAGSAGDAGDGDKELLAAAATSLVVDSAPTVTTASAAGADNSH